MSEEALSKKKRVADRQITKDDREASEEEVKIPAGEFPKADAETLAKRKIVKPKKQPTQSGAKAKNPFAAALSGANTNGSTFGSNFSSGFGEATKSSGGGFGAASSKFGASASSNGQGFGFGSSSNGSGFGSNSGGFGSTGSFASVRSTGGFGSTGASAGFGSSSNTMFGDIKKQGGSQFGFSKVSSTDSANGANKGSNEAPSSVLPDNVEIRNGEEDEECIFEVRAKSFQLVVPEAKPKMDGADTASRATFSVPASSSLLAPPSKAEGENENEEKDLTKANGDSGKDHNATTTKVAEAEAEAAVTTQKAETKASQDKGKDQSSQIQAVCEEKEGGAKKINTDSALTENVKEDAKEPKQQKVWRERGTGPLKVLKRKTDSLCRIVQRRENAPGSIGTTLLINFPLRKGCELSRQSDKHIQISTIGKDGAMSYLIKVGKPEVSRELESIMKNEIEG